MKIVGDFGWPRGRCVDVGASRVRLNLGQAICGQVQVIIDVNQVFRRLERVPPNLTCSRWISLKFGDTCSVYVRGRYPK